MSIKVKLLFLKESKEDASSCNTFGIPAGVDWKQCKSVCWCQRAIPGTARLNSISSYKFNGSDLMTISL